MFIESLFYLFATLIIISALIVVRAKNSVHSVLFLILAFFNAAGLFIMLNAEFLAMLLIVVYVGAIAVLFLFIVMMLNVDRPLLQRVIKPNLAILLGTATLIFGEFLLFIKISTINNYQINIKFPTNSAISNTEMIGHILYTDFLIPFQIVGAILFIAMVGAIFLTLKQQRNILKKQSIFKQISRDPKTAIELVNIKSGSGFDI
jgi:NADH-quinone oxidoreductase subunit J